MEGVCLLSIRRPVFRRHEAHSGFSTEHGTLNGDVKGKSSSSYTARPKLPMHRSGSDHCIVVMKRGNARGAKAVGQRLRALANGIPEELDGRGSWHEPCESRGSRTVL